MYTAPSSEARHGSGGSIEPYSVTMTLDPSTVILSASTSVESFLGYRAEILVGKPLLGLVHEADLLALYRDVFRLVMHEDERVALAVRIRTGSGSWLLCHAEVRLRDDAQDGATLSIVLYPVEER